jgi:hypothetical protein
MDDFNISVSRIEMVGRAGKNTEVCITFTFERGPIVFEMPLFLKHADFDDTEMIKAARSILHNIFAQLAVQCETWRLTSAELEELKKLNLRPEGPKGAS